MFGKSIIVVASIALSSTVYAGSIIASWDKVDDTRVTGYELMMVDRAAAYPTQATWSGTDTKTSALPTVNGTWYKARVRAVGRDNGAAIYSDWSNEIQWQAVAKETVIILGAPASIRVIQQ